VEEEEEGSADAERMEKKTGSRVVGACIVRPAFFFDGVCRWC
jgi:hypothetical protein